MERLTVYFKRGLIMRNLKRTILGDVKNFVFLD